MTKGFYFDAESCVACHVCQVACKDAHDLPVGENYRIVRSFCTGEGFAPRWYNISIPLQGCDFCASIPGGDGQPACVTGCLMRALEWGDIDELAEKHEGERIAEMVPALKDAELGRPQIMRIKDCMLDEDFDEFEV